MAATARAIAGARPGTVCVLTQGKDPTVVSIGGGPVVRFPVPAVPEKEIVDTNGAGDAFVGGFLAGLIRGRPLKACVDEGHRAAGLVIRESGCKLP